MLAAADVPLVKFYGFSSDLIKLCLEVQACLFSVGESKNIFLFVLEFCPHYSFFVFTCYYEKPANIDCGSTKLLKVKYLTPPSCQITRS